MWIERKKIIIQWNWAKCDAYVDGTAHIKNYITSSSSFVLKSNRTTGRLNDIGLEFEVLMLYSRSCALPGIGFSDEMRYFSEYQGHAHMMNTLLQDPKQWLHNRVKPHQAVLQSTQYSDRVHSFRTQPFVANSFRLYPKKKLFRRFFFLHKNWKFYFCSGQMHDILFISQELCPFWFHQTVVTIWSWYHSYGIQSPFLVQWYWP